jgi:hypothetical protein
VVALALLLIGLCAVRWPDFGPAWADASWLLPPIAAWFALRFGRAGMIAAIAITAVLVVPSIRLEDDVRIGGLPAYGLLAIVCAVAVVRGATLDMLARSPAPPRGWVLALVLLPVFFVVPVLRGDALQIDASWFALALLAPLLFVAALRGASSRDAALAVIFAIVVGLALTIAGRGSFDGDRWRIGYSFVQPGYWLLAVAAWATGAALRRHALGEAPRVPWSSPLVAVLLLFILSLDPEQFGLWLHAPLPWARPARLVYAGAFPALPLAGLAAGALMGMRGAWVAAGIALLPGLGTLAALWFSEGLAPVSIGNVLAAPIALAWGWLGAHLAGRSVEAPKLRIAGAVMIAFTLAFMALVDRGGLLQLGASVAAAFATAIGATIASRLSKRLGVTGEGWVPVAMLPVYALGAVAIVPLLAEIMGEEFGRLSRLVELPWDEGLLRVAMLVLPLVAIALALREIARGLGWVPKIIRDLRALARGGYQPAA